ncbi:mu-type opioid receptor-like [Paramacrobiotus metropolitanus]|uniref:mu-type opioid receptor-like n=1 Tax=Paramacrobiotus metropolitanus TaxID=2943436 RepID=UPI002445A95D|nr:mu-type opioid receptor-like [Paramacrobiotus metropolitanus]
MSFANNSSGVYETPKWTYVSIVSLIITILSGVFNFLVLALVIRKKRLRTSFNIYIISLLTANMMFTVIGNTLDVYNDLWSSWGLGFHVCTLYMYAIWTLTSCQIFMHFVISTNRFCAAAFPIKYRHKHTYLMAIYLSLGAWIAAHLITLPGIIIDAEKYRKRDVSKGCHIDVTINSGQQHWMICVQLSSCVVIACIMLMYSFIMYAQKLHRQKVFPKNRAASIPNEAFTSGATATKTLRAHAATLLTVITASLVVFWSPATLYYVIVPLTDGIWDTNIVAVTNMMFNFQTVMDPIIMALAVSDIRQHIWKVVHRFTKATGNTE